MDKQFTDNIRMLKDLSRLWRIIDIGNDIFQFTIEYSNFPTTIIMFDRSRISKKSCVSRIFGSW